MRRSCLAPWRARRPTHTTLRPRACTPPPGRDYTRFLDANALAGARVGIPRSAFYTEFTAPGSKRPSRGLDKEMAAQMEEAIDVLKKAGAVIVDPADIPSVVTDSAADNYLNWRVCGGLDQRKGKDADCSIVFKYGMKRDFNAWLATLGEAAPVKSLTDLRYFNLANAGRNAIKYGQSLLDISDEMDVVADATRYEADRAKDLRLAGTEGIEAIMKKERLDALLFPSGSGASIAARAGYPTVMVPFGRLGDWTTLATPRADDAEPGPAPFGVSFTGMACSEPRLIGHRVRLRAVDETPGAAASCSVRWGGRPDCAAAWPRARRATRRRRPYVSVAAPREARPSSRAARSANAPYRVW